MDLYAVIGIGVIGAVLAALLAQYKKEYAVMVSLAAGAAILLAALRSAHRVTDELERYIDAAGLERGYLEALLKSLGICFVSQFAADTCRDAGQAAIASKVELAGKIAIILAALPLFRGLLELSMRLTGL